MKAALKTISSNNPALPEDLAEWVGAVRLTHLALEAVQTVDAPLGGFGGSAPKGGSSFRMLLTLLAYAYARGTYASEEVCNRTRVDFDFRYLAANECPEADLLRHFRRREWARLQQVLAYVVRATCGSGSAGDGFDAELEAARRMERAAAADSLALDF